MSPAVLAALCNLAVVQTASSPAPECPPGPRAQLTTPTTVAAQLIAPENRIAIARVAFAEAGNQGDSGLAAVVYTIINRLISGRWGATVDAVVNAPHQFEPVMRAGGSWRRLPAVSPAGQARIDTIVNLALDGRLPDLTGGAHYFQNARIVAQRAAAGQVSPGLVHFGGATPTAVIGAHSFYAETRRSGRRSASQAPLAIMIPAVAQARPEAIFVGENRAGEEFRVSSLDTRPSAPKVAEQPLAAVALATTAPQLEGPETGAADPLAAVGQQSPARGIFVLSDGSLAEDRRPGQTAGRALQR